MGEARADRGADAAVNLRARDAVLAAKAFEAAGKILIGPQPQRKGAARRTRSDARGSHRPEQLEIGLGIRISREHCTIDPESLHRKRLGDKGLIRQHVAAARLAVRLGPKPMAMKER